MVQDQDQNVQVVEDQDLGQGGKVFWDQEMGQELDRQEVNVVPVLKEHYNPAPDRGNRMGDIGLVLMEGGNRVKILSSLGGRLPCRKVAGPDLPGW